MDYFLNETAGECCRIMEKIDEGGSKAVSEEDLTRLAEGIQEIAAEFMWAYEASRKDDDIDPPSHSLYQAMSLIPDMTRALSAHAPGWQVPPVYLINRNANNFHTTIGIKAFIEPDCFYKEKFFDDGELFIAYMEKGIRGPSLDEAIPALEKPVIERLLSLYLQDVRGFQDGKELRSYVSDKVMFFGAGTSKGVMSGLRKMVKGPKFPKAPKGVMEMYIKRLRLAEELPIIGGTLDIGAMEGLMRSIKFKPSPYKDATLANVVLETGKVVPSREDMTGLTAEELWAKAVHVDRGTGMAHPAEDFFMAVDSPSLDRLGMNIAAEHRKDLYESLWGEADAGFWLMGAYRNIRTLYHLLSWYGNPIKAIWASHFRFLGEGERERFEEAINDRVTTHYIRALQYMIRVEGATGQKIIKGIPKGVDV